MKKCGMLGVVTVLVVVIAAAYGLSVAEGPADGPVIVVIDGSAFSPEVATVKVGGEVVWKNKDAAPHTITADDESFDSGSLNQGDEYRRKFTKAGTVKYSCGIHAYMSGKIEVR
ncbi:MAG: cupredoxin domain-containing protein [Thermodesulfovibrionales bacterium]